MNSTPHYMVHEVFNQRDISGSFEAESRMSMRNFDQISWENEVKESIMLLMML